jgi:hypothetical protein
MIRLQHLLATGEEPRAREGVPVAPWLVRPLGKVVVARVVGMPVGQVLRGQVGWRQPGLRPRAPVPVVQVVAVEWE